MEVTRIPPLQPPQPPPTYNITGLTEREAVLLKDILGKFRSNGPTSPMWRKLTNALPACYDSPEYGVGTVNESILPALVVRKAGRILGEGEL